MISLCLSYFFLTLILVLSYLIIFESIWKEIEKNQLKVKVNFNKYVYIRWNIKYIYYQNYGVIFVDEKEIKSLFEKEEDARNVLEKSRKRIDEIDNDLVNLISERTSLARDIVLAKVFLGMEIYDKSREAQVHAKVNKLAEDLKIDKDILSDIMDMLTTLSKNRQKEILEEWLWEILELHS